MLPPLTVTLQPNALAYNTIGSIYADQGKYQWALDNFNKATGADPGLDEAYFNQGAVLYNMTFYERAIKMFMKVLEVIPMIGRRFLSGQSLGLSKKMG